MRSKDVFQVLDMATKEVTRSMYEMYLLSAKNTYSLTEMRKLYRCNDSVFRSIFGKLYTDQIISINLNKITINPKILRQRINDDRAL